MFPEFEGTSWIEIQTLLAQDINIMSQKASVAKQLWERQTSQLSLHF